MRVVFIGATKFGLSCLAEVARLPDIEIVGVITNDQSFSISYSEEKVKNVLWSDFAQYTSNNEIELYCMKDNMLEAPLLKKIENWKPDLFLVIGWYHMIPKNLRLSAPAIGLHASLLPDYSGGAPLVWAIINGESKTGISLFQFDDGVDSGPIIEQQEEPIYYGDTIGDLYARIEEKGKDLLCRNLPKITNGTAQYHSQNEAARKVYPQRSPRDGVIDWNWSCSRIYNFVRAQTKPYPGAYCIWKGSRLRVWSVREILNHNLASPIGDIVVDNDKLLVVCGQGAVAIENFSFEDGDCKGELQNIVNLSKNI